MTPSTGSRPHPSKSLHTIWNTRAFQGSQAVFGQVTQMKNVAIAHSNAYLQWTDSAVGRHGATCLLLQSTP